MQYDYFPVIRARVLFDTGPLLLLAFHGFHNGRYLPHVSANVPLRDVRGLVLAIQKILSNTRQACVTAYVLAEFHAVARSRAGLDRKGLMSFIHGNIEFLDKLQEIPVPKSEILRSKVRNALEFCFADTSLMVAASREDAPILTTDDELRQFCRGHDIPSLHAYYDCYLRLG